MKPAICSVYSPSSPDQASAMLVLLVDTIVSWCLYIWSYVLEYYYVNDVKGSGG